MTLLRFVPLIAIVIVIYLFWGYKVHAEVDVGVLILVAVVLAFVRMIIEIIREIIRYRNNLR